MFSSGKRFSVTGNTLNSVRVHRQPDRRAVIQPGKQEAFIGGGFGGMAGMGVGGNVSMAVQGPMQNVSMLAGLVSQEETYLRPYYRDMYYYDAVGGSAVDMISTFPYSEFSLTGIEPERIEKYLESMVRLNIRTLMPEITLTYLVDGAYCASLLFDNKDKVFIDLLNYPIDNCTIDDLPFFGTNPIIRVKSTEALRKFVTSPNQQARILRQQLPSRLVDALSRPEFELDTLTSLYIARKTLPGTEPTSWLKRMLPAYLMEKTLYRGTLVEAQRRQRAMLHIAMGDDTHEFTPEEMAETVQQFQAADLDPLGAVIGTRNNVQATEVRQGGDFWKWTDNIDILVPHKLRALGISEAFLAGDATYSNVETGMSVFMENTDALRSTMTYEVLTNKVFPIVAIANNFYKDGKNVRIQTRRDMHHQLTNHNDLDIPIVRWHKQLEAKAEDNMMETLTELSEKGFPIPMRMWAAAAKIDMESLYEDLRQDKEIKDKLSKLTGKHVDVDGAAGAENMDGGGSDDGGGGWGGEEANLRRMTRHIQRQSLLNRKFSEESSEVKSQTKTGKAKWVRDQRGSTQKLNRLMAKAMVQLSDPNNKSAALKRVSSRLGHIPKLL